MASESSQYDPMEFLRSVWGQMPFPVPGFVTPTLDVGELDKRIADLKAVEGWLRMNMGMLQTSIQGLEVQRLRGRASALQIADRLRIVAAHPHAGGQSAGKAHEPAILVG